MGLSQGQKKRRYGANTKAAHIPEGGTPDPQHSETRELRQFMEERAAHDQATGRGSRVFLHVAVAISLLMGVYLFAWVLPGYGRLAGAPVPELSLALSTDALGSFAHGLSSSPAGDALGPYTYAHRSVGLAFAVFFGLSVAGLSWAATAKKPLRVLLTALPLVYSAVFTATIFAVDASLADPAHQPGALVVLLPLGWALLVLSLLSLAYRGVRAFKRAVAAFIAGGPPTE